MIEPDNICLGKFIYNIRDISPKQLGVTSRQINYWIDKKATPFLQKQQEATEEGEKTTKAKWIRLDLAQAVWVCIIKELLSLGISIEGLEKLAEQVWQRPREEKYADKALRDHLQRKNSPFSIEDRQTIKSYLEDEMHMENYLRTVINPFTDMVKSAVLRKELPHSLIYIPKTNEHQFLMNDNELMIKLSSAYMEHPLISIPIVPIIAKVLAIDFMNPNKELSYLSNIEQQIRDIVIFKKPKTIQIAFENDHIKPITITEQHKTKEQLARYILENKIAKNSKLLIDIRSQGNYVLTLIKK